jgi:tetratricopeptide (TPR) repeat protein
MAPGALIALLAGSLLLPAPVPPPADDARAAASRLVAEARSLYADGSTDEAESRLRQALEKEPGLGEAHYYLGRLLMATGRKGAALEEFAAALSASVAASRRPASSSTG